MHATLTFLMIVIADACKYYRNFPGVDPCQMFTSTRLRDSRTKVSIVGEQWYVNGEPANKGKQWKGAPIEGTLFNARMVNAVFDDLNDHSKHIWKYPDTGVWDAERNTREMVAAMDDYAAKGLQAVTVSLQGGSPCGNNPSDNHEPCGSMYNRDSSSFSADGRLRVSAFNRMASIIEKADELGMVVFMQLFYPDIAWRLFESDDANVERAADNTVDWLIGHNYENVVLDVCNECNLCQFMPNRGDPHGPCPQERMDLATLNWPPYGDHGGLLDRIRNRARARGKELILSSSYVGGYLPCRHNTPSKAEQPCREVTYFDYINIHGNNLWQYKDGSLAEMVDIVRMFQEFKARPMPVVISEDDGLCAHDGILHWFEAETLMNNAELTGNIGGQGSACYFHWDECHPSRSTKCALGQSVAANISWGLFLVSTRGVEWASPSNVTAVANCRCQLLLPVLLLLAAAPAAALMIICSVSYGQGCCGFTTCPSWAHKYELGHGFQCPPVNWNWQVSPDKKSFFDTLYEATGGVTRPRPLPSSPPPVASPPPPPSTPPSSSSTSTSQSSPASTPQSAGATPPGLSAYPKSPGMGHSIITIGLTLVAVGCLTLLVVGAFWARERGRRNQLKQQQQPSKGVSPDSRRKGARFNRIAGNDDEDDEDDDAGGYEDDALEEDEHEEGTRRASGQRRSLSKRDFARDARTRSKQVTIDDIDGIQTTIELSNPRPARGRRADPEMERRRLAARGDVFSL